jgi:hypothetical protein
LPGTAPCPATGAVALQPELPCGVFLLGSFAGDV